MLTKYLLFVSLNFWAISCEEKCDCAEIGVLKKVLQDEMLDRKMESARTIIKVEELLSSINYADQVTAIETKIADIYGKLNELSEERHVEKTIAIVEKALTSEKVEWTDFMFDTERQLSHIADTVLKFKTLVNKTECFSGKAHNYKTTKRTTISGYQCQRWDSQTPHEHEYKEDQFPEDCSFCQAKNYCRDPGEDGFLWCYTTDPEKRWEGCGIPWCEEPERNDNTHDCYIIPTEDRQSGYSDKELCERKVNRFEVNVTTGYTPGCTNCENCCQVKDCHTASCPHCYTGTWHRAVSGRECQRWDAQFPHKHENDATKKFRLDRSVTAAHNYCRDPSKSGFTSHSSAADRLRDHTGSSLIHAKFGEIITNTTKRVSLNLSSPWIFDYMLIGSLPDSSILYTCMGHTEGDRKRLPLVLYNGSKSKMGKVRHTRMLDDSALNARRIFMRNCPCKYFSEQLSLEQRKCHDQIVLLFTFAFWTFYVFLKFSAELYIMHFDKF